MSNLAFLRMLNVGHVQTGALVEDLKQFDLSTVVTRSSVPTPSDPLVASGSVATGTAAPFGTMLDTAMEEIFVPHTEGTKYLERESKSLGEMYLNLLLRFTKYHVSLTLYAPQMTPTYLKPGKSLKVQNLKFIRTPCKPTSKRCSYFFVQFDSWEHSRSSRRSIHEI